MTTPLLEGYRRCRGSDPDRMEAYLDTVGFRVEALHDDDAPLDMRVKGVYLPGMYIGYTQYGKAATIRAAPERTDYWFLLPVHGTLEARVRKDLVDCDPRRGVLSDPSRTGQLVRSETGCGRLNIILTETAIQRQLGGRCSACRCLARRTLSRRSMWLRGTVEILPGICGWRSKISSAAAQCCRARSRCSNSSKWCLRTCCCRTRTAIPNRCAGSPGHSRRVM